jgi:hypothetical protein
MEEGRAYRIEVQLDPKMPPGPFAGTLRIKTDSAKAPSLEVPIKGTVTTTATAAAPDKPGTAGGR